MLVSAVLAAFCCSLCRCFRLVTWTSSSQFRPKATNVPKARQQTSDVSTPFKHYQQKCPKHPRNHCKRRDFKHTNAPVPTVRPAADLRARSERLATAVRRCACSSSRPGGAKTRRPVRLRHCDPHRNDEWYFHYIILNILKPYYSAVVNYVINMNCRCRFSEIDVPYSYSYAICGGVHIRASTKTSCNEGDVAQLDYHF